MCVFARVCVHKERSILLSRRGQCQCGGVHMTAECKALGGGGHTQIQVLVVPFVFFFAIKHSRLFFFSFFLTEPRQGEA